MYYIYKFTNLINSFSYIGQTKDAQKRKIQHKSASFNKKSNSYSTPFHIAARKYGWENFSFEILEEIDDMFFQDYIDERERFFINYYNSLVGQKGYNVLSGGLKNGSRTKKSFDDCCECSKLFTREEIIKIQDMLIKGYQYYEIKKLFPILTNSFLTNINTGLNFKRDNLNYPLSNFHSRFSKTTQEEIIQELKNGTKLSDISKKYGISTSYISSINKGKRWYKKDESYPLHKYTLSGKWSKDCKYDIIFTDLTFEQLANKYNKSIAAIKAVSQGKNRRDKRLCYPLRKNKNKNQEIWANLFL